MSNFLANSRSQLNKSASKQLYSFSKSKRFSNIKQSLCKTSYYDPRVSAIGKRTTSLGYGNKTNFAFNQTVPSPGAYERQGSFVNSIKKRRGYSFGNQQKKGIINEQQQFTPGPGKYSYSPDKKDFKNVKYSLGSQIADVAKLHQNPLGPGQYQTVQSINKDGKYFYSKYISSGCSKIGNQKRLKMLKSITPGPGNYQDAKVTQFNKTGKYFYSAFKTVKSNSFSITSRKHFADVKKTPGPGTYTTYSDFPSQYK